MHENTPVLDEGAGAFFVLQRALQWACKKAVMCGKEGGDTCATCCHILSVAAVARASDWCVVTQRNWPDWRAGGFASARPEQAVLTDPGNLPEPLSYRGWGQVGGVLGGADTV
jgi:hypothetical protein